MRLLVTGSRAWCGPTSMVAQVLKIAAGDAPTVTLVHGDARGADRIAAGVARAFGWTVEAHPADWSTGRSAGIHRNLQMLDSGIDQVVVFWDGRSPGTKQCMRAAADRHLPVTLIVHQEPV